VDAAQEARAQSTPGGFWVTLASVEVAQDGQEIDPVASMLGEGGSAQVRIRTAWVSVTEDAALGGKFHRQEDGTVEAVVGALDVERALLRVVDLIKRRQVKGAL
jgi:hypothetical protein